MSVRKGIRREPDGRTRALRVWPNPYSNAEAGHLARVAHPGALTTRGDQNSKQNSSSDESSDPPVPPRGVDAAADVRAAGDEIFCFTFDE